MQLLADFIKNSNQPREIKRATAVKMLLSGYKHEEIMPILGVSSGFISTYKLELLNQEFCPICLHKVL
ncbi:hypothetical protein CUN59_01875 [Cuspidothrix issatschenkoi CHARLIE-1]|uniref:Transposase n=1 Tax=Cuspidothrix issatschenkoi CHARLIE-1 TaxID=2052836 RepID=A0A2S6CYW0_9CYAN|nr:hypothetical protein CUN59_01875 [Cuspidothrix issatschenkoi CHARLIE-1]